MAAKTPKPTTPDWGVVDQDVTVDFFAAQVPCADPRLNGLSVEVRDPNGEEVPNTVMLIGAYTDPPHLFVHFHPSMVGFHHIAVHFNWQVGIRQRDVLIVKELASSPGLILIECKRVTRMPQGTLICDDRIFTPEGQMTGFLAEPDLRAPFGSELWTTGPQVIAHYREIGPGVLERLERQVLPEQRTFIKILGEPGGRAIAVDADGLSELTPEDGGISVGAVQPTPVSPHVENAFKVGERIFVATGFINGSSQPRFLKLCPQPLQSGGFVPKPVCAEIQPDVFGVSDDGLWTFERDEIRFVSLQADGGMIENAARQVVPSSFVSGGGFTPPSSYPLMSVRLEPGYQWDPKPQFVVSFVNGEVELRHVPKTMGALTGANETALWNSDRSRKMTLVAVP